MTASPTLDHLRDLHLPPEAGLWPPAPGWWLVAAVLALLAGFAVRRQLRRRPLRSALRELDALAAAQRDVPDPVRFAAGLSRLVRRYALWRFPRREIAGLSGSAWLAFLDEHGGGGRFRDGAGALLESLPYAPPTAGRELDPAGSTALAALVRDWLRSNAP
jgi:uncharacterized protein DUF4381